LRARPGAIGAKVFAETPTERDQEGSMDEVKTERSAAEDKEAFHRAAEARIQTFSYKKPADNGAFKQFASLVRSDLVRLNVQIVKQGGENNLHYHTGGDNCWMVIRGAARFYGPGDKLIGEFGPNEGLLLPGGARYWFEKTGDEDLEILQIVCKESRQAQTQRINLDKHKDWMTDDYLKVYEKK
jgi:mannose-6-phosphate isomerase-like protein (cupin superfamily)